MGDIYKGILPFVVLQIVGLGLMIAFPGIITWLPSLFFGN
jgi:TRAP-type mannitol/chloroaromatic compound transport system permease large subunit